MATVVFKESLLSSVLSDVASTSILVGAVWFNQTFVDGSNFLNATLLIIWLLWVAARASGKQITNRKDALQAVDEIFPETQG